MQFTFVSKSEADTQLLGKALADALPPGAIVAMQGTLGAGKTRFAQAIAAALGVDPRDVVSPTFVLVQEHAGRMPVYHFDLYRLADEDEFWELGIEEYFAGQGVCLIEWADKFAESLPADRLEVRIIPTSPTERRFEIQAVGTSYVAVLQALQSVFD